MALISVFTDTPQTIAPSDPIVLDQSDLPGENEIALIVLSFIDENETYLDGTTVEVDDIGVVPSKLLVQASGLAGVLVFAVGGPFTGDSIIANVILGPGSGSADITYRAQYLRFGNVDADDADLAAQYAQTLIVADPMELTLTPANAADTIIAIGAADSEGAAPTVAFETPFLASQQAPIDSTGLTGAMASMLSWLVPGTVETTAAFASSDGVAFGLMVFVFRAPGGGGGGGGLCADITGFNCTPYPDNTNKTLAEYRHDLLLRAGFAAVASNPPPGTAALFNAFLQDAQTFLFRKYPALETRWIFRWALEEGVRYYGIRDNDGLEGDCSIFMDPYKNIEGAFLVDLNGQWLPMTFGIPPPFYTTVNNPALPFRLEIRQCVEIFPAPPADGYFLMIKGHFGLQAFTEDDDKPTIDGHLVYLWALANALDYYGKPSAAGVATQAKDYLGELVAGTHAGKRYIPGTRPANPAIMPVYAPWPGEY